MKDDNNSNDKKQKNEESTLSSADRFTTKDLDEIDELLNDNFGDLDDSTSSKKPDKNIKQNRMSSQDVEVKKSAQRKIESQNELGQGERVKSRTSRTRGTDLDKDNVRPIASEIQAAREQEELNNKINKNNTDSLKQGNSGGIKREPESVKTKATQPEKAVVEEKTDKNEQEEKPGGIKKKLSNWILGGESETIDPVENTSTINIDTKTVKENSSDPGARAEDNKRAEDKNIKDKTDQKVAATPSHNTTRIWLENRAEAKNKRRARAKTNANPSREERTNPSMTKKEPRNNRRLQSRKKSPHTRGLPKRHPKKPWAKTLLICLAIVAVLGVIGATGVYLLYTANFTDISNTEYTPKEKTVIYTSDNVQIASLFSQNRSYVSIEQVPQDLKNALVATEDSRFYTHNGVDYRGVLRALLSNILGGNSTGQGASTITQQLARLLYLPDIATESTFMDSLNRKFKEISISYQLEDKYTKDQILEMYLNEYYFGSAAYGIESAAETYFGKSVDQLNLAESAMLAGLPQAPSVYAPNVNFDAAKNRQKQVLQRMVDNGFINQQQADEAYNTPINVVPWSEESLNNQIAPGYQNFVGKVIDEYAKAVAPNIMRERGLSQSEAESYARQNIASGGYKFYTTVNSKMQEDAIGVMQSYLDSFGYDQENGYTGTLVTVDRSSAVRSYYGGNEEISDIDMADMPRQPGSNIKPLYYAMALERGVYEPNSVLNDTPIDINGYSPRNSDGGYSGPISFSQSLILSKNTTSVQIFNTLGTQATVDWLKQFGFDSITDDDYNLASALGGFTYGTKTYQMAAAFNTFNDGGVYNQAYFIDRVTTTSGETVLDKNKLGLVSKQMMSPQTAQAMWNIMQGVVTGGTGTNAQNALPTAGKTGTTDNHENLWFTGMTGNLTTSIWLGNLDYYVLGGGSYLPASVYAGYINTLHGQGLVN